MAASRSRVRGNATAMARGVCQASAETTGLGRRTWGRRTGGAAPPAAAMPARRRKTPPVYVLDGRPRRPRVLGRGQRPRHQVLRRRRLESEHLQSPLQLAVRKAVDLRRVVAVAPEVARALHVGRLEDVDRLRDELLDAAQDDVAVARVRVDHVLEEANAERDVAVLVLLDQPEPLLEARVRRVVLHVLEDEALARHGEHALDDQVVGRDPLDEQLEVLRVRLDAVGDLAQAAVEDVEPGALHALLELHKAPAQVVRIQSHHLGAEAVEEDGVARLVDELRCEEGLDLPARRGQEERGEVGGHALLAYVERAEAPGRVLLRLGRRRQPLLAVDAEVELVRAPVLALPERVQLAVAHEVAAAPGVAGGLVRGVATVGRRRDRALGREWRAVASMPAPRPHAALLHVALARLALEFGVVAALRAV